MILDARCDSIRLNRGTRVAIVGAGPAGLTLARELAGVAEVLVIEAGGLECDEDADELLGGECAGLRYPLTETRARVFGGSSSLWAGYCAQFDEHDFRRRDWVPGSGWPFGQDALRPYFAGAAALLNLGEASFDAHAVARGLAGGYALRDEGIVATVWRFGAPTLRLNERAAGEFNDQAFTTLINATVVDLELVADHGSLKALRVRTRNGREGRIEADVAILACGGLETPRLLLGANRQRPAGIGNAHGLVGRHFMEHPHREIPCLVVEDAPALVHWTGRGCHEDQREFAFCAGLPAQVQQEAGILNARAHVYRTPRMRSEEAPRVGLFLEQAPNPVSRVTLARATDPLGMRRLRLDWRLSALDWHSYQRTAAEIADAFVRSGLARLSAPVDTVRPADAPLLHSNHHLGTTRMSMNAEEGVVNADSRVHEVENLYVAGGSVFPTVSWANPTFTVLALSLRLADHLKSDVLR